METSNFTFLLIRSGSFDLSHYRDGTMGRLEGAICTLSEHASPPSEGEKLFGRRFLAFTIP